MKIRPGQIWKSRDSPNVIQIGKRYASEHGYWNTRKINGSKNNHRISEYTLERYYINVKKPNNSSISTKNPQKCYI